MKKLFIILTLLVSVQLTANSNPLEPDSKTDKAKKKDHVIINSSLDLGLGLSSQLNTSQKKFYIIPDISLRRNYRIKVNDLQLGASLLLGSEFVIDPQMIYGFKLSPSVYILKYSLAFTFVYYTNFEKGNFKIRPEFGWNYDNLRISIGYNIPTYENSAFLTMKDSDIQLTICYYLPLLDAFKIEVKH